MYAYTHICTSVDHSFVHTNYFPVQKHPRGSNRVEGEKPKLVTPSLLLHQPSSLPPFLDIPSLHFPLPHPNLSRVRRPSMLLLRHFIHLLLRRIRRTSSKLVQTSQLLHAVRITKHDPNGTHKNFHPKKIQEHIQNANLDPPPPPTTTVAPEFVKTSTPSSFIPSLQYTCFYSRFCSIPISIPNSIPCLSPILDLRVVNLMRLMTRQSQTRTTKSIDLFPPLSCPRSPSLLPSCEELRNVITEDGVPSFVIGS